MPNNSEETTQGQQTIFEPAQAGVKICATCEKTFNGKGQYCSDSCRALFSYRKRKADGAPAAKEKKSAPEAAPAPGGGIASALNGVDSASKYIIHHQEKEIARWEKNFEAEKKKREDLERQLADLKEKHSTELSGLKDRLKAKETALQGLEDKEPPVWEKALGFIPDDVKSKFLGLLVDKVMAPADQIAGVSGQLDQATAHNLKMINQWFVAQPIEVQESLWMFIETLAQIKDPSELNATLARISNILKNGPEKKSTNTAHADVNLFANIS